MSQGPILPVCMLPGASELVFDEATQAYHLNVGFTMSFAVKELLETLTMVPCLRVVRPAASPSNLQ